MTARRRCGEIRDNGTQTQCRLTRVPVASACAWRASIKAVDVGLTDRRDATSGSVTSQNHRSTADGIAAQAKKISQTRVERRLIDFRT